MGVSPVPEDVATELTRVVRRWQQLPLDHALVCMPLVRALVDDLAARAWPASLGEPRAVPDLGPAAVVDQLRVLVHDACAAGVGDDLLDRLVGLRRAIG
ncbi:hypothetical protein ACQP1U_14420 [Actinomycetota bacterium]|nr:hypothetical protein [Micrococcales bacterium]